MSVSHAFVDSNAEPRKINAGWLTVDSMINSRMESGV